MDVNQRTHPRIADAGALCSPAQNAAAMGYRAPAEWEPQACVWLVPPFNAETWPGCLDKAQDQFADWMARLKRYTPVRTPDQVGATNNDSWVRDYGPIFVVKESCESTKSLTPSSSLESRASNLALQDFRFDSWGGKYDPPEVDDVFPQHVAHDLDLPIWIHDFVLEGGSIDVNGTGTVMTTEQCLLNAGRNPGLSRADIEATLRDTLGVTHIVWLPGGIVGDDTDGHVDDAARFIAPDTVAVVSADTDHPDRVMTRANVSALRTATDQAGQSLNILELPAPPPMPFDYPGDRFIPARRELLPASYANFLISNGGVFVPVFDQPTDDLALRLLDDAMPSHTIEPIRAEWLVVGQGALHCLSMPQPAV